MTSPASGAFGPRRWRDATVAFLLTNVAFGPVVICNRFRSEIAGDLGLGAEVAAIVYCSFFVLGGLTALCLLRWIARLRFAMLAVIGAFGLGAGAILCSISEGAFAFAASWAVLVSAVGGTPYLSPLLAFVARRSRLGMATNMSLATVGQLTAFSFWNIVLGWLGLTDWRACLASCGIACVVVLPLAVLLLGPHEDATPRLKRAASSTGIPLPLCAAAFSATAGAGTFAINSIPSFENAAAGLPYGIGLFGVFGIFGIVGRMVAGTVFDARRSEAVPLAFLLSLAAGGFALPVLDGYGGMIAAAALGTGYGGVLPVTMALALGTAGTSRESISSMMFACGSLGLAAGSLSSGIAARYGDFRLGASCWSAVLLLVAVVWFRLLRRRSASSR